MRSVEAEYGSQPRITLECTNTDTDAFFDPSAVFFVVTRPSGSTTTYDYGADAEVVKSATGVYYMLLTINAWGTWHVRAGFSGTSAGSMEWRIWVPRPRAIELTGIYAKKVPAARTLVVGSRRDEDEAEISGSIRMRKNSTLVWLIDYSRTQLAYSDLVDGATAPVVGGAQAANLTINATEGTGWGVDPDGGGILIRCVATSSADPDDEIYITLSIQGESSDPDVIVIPVEIYE